MITEYNDSWIISELNEICCNLGYSPGGCVPSGGNSAIASVICLSHQRRLRAETSTKNGCLVLILKLYHGLDICNQRILSTAQCCDNAVNFLQNPHDTHPKARPWVSVVIIISDSLSATVIAVSYVISWNIRPRYNATRLYFVGFVKGGSV